VLVKFRVRGNLRFLSHAEMVKVLERACVRGGIQVQYSQGFNPHPRLSLPLPRSVGVESDDELLCVRIDKSIGAQEHRSIGDLCSSIKTKLSEQLPEGLELVSADVGRGVPQPRLATYLLEVRSEYVNERLKARTGALLACESLEVQRQTDHKRAKLKNVDVRGFLKSIELDDNNIEVKCKVSSAGTIRVDEILRLLELDVAKLAGPIRRTNVEWEEG